MLWTDKHRPASFQQVVGQARVARAMAAFATQPDMPHVLLHGPPGSGKTATAMCALRSVYGEDFGASVLLLNASDERNARVMRDTVAQFASCGSPLGGPAPRFKVVALDEADSLTPEAQRCLQSLMDTQAARVRFVLTCNYVSQLCEGLLSRCVRLATSPVPDQDVASVLAGVCDSEGVLADPASLRLLASWCGGDLRRALTALQGLAAAGSLADPARVARGIGVPAEGASTESLLQHEAAECALPATVRALCRACPGLRSAPLLPQLYHEAHFAGGAEPVLRRALWAVCKSCT